MSSAAERSETERDGERSGPERDGERSEPERDGRGSEPRHRGRRAPFVALAVAAVLAGLFVVLAGADSSRNETAATPLMGRPAPGGLGTLADGSDFDLATRKGSWVVLNFFTADCVPCQREHDDLVQFDDEQRALGLDGAELYTIVFDDDRDDVEAFFAERGGDWPVVYDDSGSIAVGFGVAKVPETWIIDPDGVVRGRIISEVTADFLSAELRQLREGS